MPREIDHAALLHAALRELAGLRLAWLRDPGAAASGSHGQAPVCSRLLGPEGAELLERALRDHHYRVDELARLPDLLGEVARAHVLLGGRRWLGHWLASPLALGSSQGLPAQALGSLSDPTAATFGPTLALRGLEHSLEPHAERFVELHARAEHEANERALAVSRLTRPAASVQAAGPAAQPQEAAPPAKGRPALHEQEAGRQGEIARARIWLERTDDAARELFRWLRRRVELPGAESDLARLCIGLRAADLDGLARPTRRLYRLSEGARRLGFERDMSARMRGETARGLVIPLPVCVALAVPGDVRVLQPSLEYGLLSDLAVAQAIGEALTLALASPAAGPVMARVSGASVSAAVGGLFAQLRADADCLRRVDGLERDPAHKAARQAAVSLLLRTRLAAASMLALAEPARSDAERCAQLSAAGERALGCPVSAGPLAASLSTTVTAGEQFAGLAWGLELHVGLRERLDEDFYVNPRTADVLRGAAARGAALDARELAVELGVDGSNGVARLLELLD